MATASTAIAVDPTDLALSVARRLGGQLSVFYFDNISDNFISIQHVEQTLIHRLECRFFFLIR